MKNRGAALAQKNRVIHSRERANKRASIVSQQGIYCVEVRRKNETFPQVIGPFHSLAEAHSASKAALAEPEDKRPDVGL